MNNILPERDGKKRIIIIGGGFAGLKLARSLHSDLFQVVLLDKNNYHQFQPLLYQIATSSIEPSTISFPFRKIFQHHANCTFRMCSVLELLPTQKLVRTDAGTLDYDFLVIAAGCKTNYFDKSADLINNSLSLKSVSEALFVRNHILNNLEKAINTDSYEERRRLMTFVIVGGGATGVELAGALAEMRRYEFPKDYPELDFSQMRIIVVDGIKQLLSSFSKESSTETYNQLLSMGIEFRLEKLVTDYEQDLVTLSDGETIESASLFWVGGVIGNRIDGLSENSWGKGCRLMVNEFNQLLEYDSIFAIGDIALQTSEQNPKGDPQVAQVAIQQGEHLAHNLEKIVKGESPTPFSYRNKGAMATIGRNVAVAEIAKYRFFGFSAWLLWSLVHLIAIIGAKNRFLIFIDWIWSYLVHNQSLRILIKPLSRKL